VFIAIPVGEAAAAAVRELVVGVVDDPRVREAGRLRWAVTPELHLTVRFLGPTAPDRVPDVAAAAEAAVAGLAPFAVRLRGAGAFPTPARPRVVWLGIERGAPDLAALAGRLSDELGARGWPPDDRPFRAHLTLARADGVPGAARAVDALAAAAAGLDAAWTADRLVVYRSDLGRRPPRYTPLATARLGPRLEPPDAARTAPVR
jgi:2'-5' RNA ligase